MPGSVLEWDAEGGRITVRRAGRYTFEDLYRAMFAELEPRPRSVEEMEEGVRRNVRARRARR